VKIRDCQPGQKISEIPTQERSWVWWYKSIIPATLETEVRRIRVEVGPGKEMQELTRKITRAKKG
jgi:hypothetical protein